MNTPFNYNAKQVNSLLEEAYGFRVNNLNYSIELANEALSISRKLNDKALTAKSLNQLALFHMIMGDYRRSMRMSKKAMQYFKELNDEMGIANAKYNIAGVYYKTDNYHLGLVNLIDCLTIYLKFHDYHNQARTYKSLGTIYEYFGDENNAVKSYQNSIKAAKKAEDSNLESNAYNPLSGIYLKQNKIEKALNMIERSIKMKTLAKDVRGLAFAFYGRAKIYTRTGKFEEAENDLNESIRIHQEMGERLGLGMAYYKMGVLYFETGRLEMAKNILEKAIEFSTEYNIVLIKIKSKQLLYRIYRQENEPVRSLEYLEAYLKEKESVINTQTLKIIENYELITKMKSLEKEAQLQKEKAEIVEKKNRAEESARLKDEFLSAMSHEMRTPLNAVLTITSLLDAKDDKEQKRLIDSLKFSANNLLLLINDLLDFMRLDSNKVQLEIRSCNFISMVERVKNSYMDIAKAKGLDLVLKMDETFSEYYEMDETKISQILNNLINNAIKFTQHGKVEINIEKIDELPDMDHIRFKIIDTGIGIQKDHLLNIFDSFTHIKSVTTRKQDGAGIGLAIVKKIIALHQSTIHVSSVVNKGSIFYFDLKLRKSLSPNKPNLKHSNISKIKNVLIVEDNQINAILTSQLLSNWQMKSELAVNGIEAVQKSKQKLYDLILMDIHMPEMNGFEAAKHIRTVKNPNIKTPIFALTADVTAEYQEEYTAYFNLFFLKPLNINKLQAALKNIA